MALSGSFSQTFATYYRLQLEWSATQNYGNNTSTITARLYLMSLRSTAPINSSATKTFRITIAGTPSATTGNLNLSGNQKKLLHTFTHTVTHNSDGTLTVPIQGFMQWGLNINGHTSDVTINRTETLNTIARGSTVASGENWRAGTNTTIGINRASTAYTHTVRIYVDNALIATRTGAGASAQFTFTYNELLTLFTTMGRMTSFPSRVEVDTYSGSTKIGATATKTGVITGAMPSSLVTPLPSSSNYVVGQLIPFKLNVYDSKMNHTFIVRDHNGAEIMRHEVEPGITEFYLDTNLAYDEFHDLIGADDSYRVEFELYTKFDMQVIRDPYVYFFAMYPDRAGIEPTFPGPVSFTEANSNVISVLGSYAHDYFLAGESNIQVDIPTSGKAVASGNATITQYQFVLAGASRVLTSIPSGAISTIIGSPQYAGMATGVATARDSRGADVSIYVPKIVIPYGRPTARVTAERVNRFEDSTVITFDSSYQPIVIESIPRNSMITRRYRRRVKGGSWSGWTSLDLNQSITTVTLSLDNTQAHEIEFEVVDRLRSNTAWVTVQPGKPTMFLDSSRNSVGINMFPTMPHALQVDGEAYIGDDDRGFLHLGGFGDMYRDGSRIFFSGGELSIQPYASDFSFFTSKPVFWFSAPIQANLQGNVQSSGASSFNQLTVNGSATFHNEPITSAIETGYCGVGGYPNGQAITGSVAGVGVNFRIRKNYVPSSITLTVSSEAANTGGVDAIDITQNGFWLHVRGGGTANIGYHFWRGTYRA